MVITGTLFSYYHICQRKLWLFAHGIQMERTSDLVAMGRLIHESSYPQRTDRFTELAIEGIKLDFYDPHRRIVHEIKKSNKLEEAHIWQVKFYLRVLAEHGMSGITGILEYPKLHYTQEVTLTKDDISAIDQMKADISTIIKDDNCPAKLVKKKQICRSCSYYDFCYVGEDSSL